MENIIRAVNILKQGGIIVYPTDTVYGFGCSIFDAEAIDKIRKLKGKKGVAPFSIICSTLEEVRQCAVIDDETFRIMQKVLPGPYTFIVNATEKMPRFLVSTDGKVGIRIPDHPVPLEIVRQLGHPIITTSVNFTGENCFTDPQKIKEVFGDKADLIIDGGVLGIEASTILEQTDDGVRVVRVGKGNLMSW